MKIKIAKVIKWYEWEHHGTDYDVRVVSLKNNIGMPVKDVTIFKGSAPVLNNPWLYQAFSTDLMFHEGM